MTQDEKFAWLSQPTLDRAKMPEGALGSAGYYPGIPRLGIPPMQQSDASLGVTNPGNFRPDDNATALPASLLLGATFNPAMALATGVMVGQEARAKGFDVQLAGGANLIRDPRGGRDFEYVSEDPLLTGLIAGNSVAGIQSQGVVSTVKHFAVNAQETRRTTLSADIAEAPLRESDLLAFQIAIEIGRPGSVMSAYNQVNGTYASENRHLLTDVLKTDWQYPGWVMSDWGSVHSTGPAVQAGLDVESAANYDRQPYFGQKLREAVTAGAIPQTRIDDMVRRQLRGLFAVGVIDNPPKPGGAIDYMAHRLLAQREAEQGIVLLKNERNVLPLAKGVKRLLVVGGHADQGVLAGGGSSLVTPIGSVFIPGAKAMGADTPFVYHPSPPLQAIRAEAGAAVVDFVDGTDPAAAADAAKNAEAVFVFVGEWRSEGFDASGLALPGQQDALIEAVVAANPNTIVVIESGGPVTMPWLAHVPAVLAAWYPGSGGGEAIAGILFGRIDPSGRLPVTFPADAAQLPRPAELDPATADSPGPGKSDILHVSYEIEGSDVGYRWFERQQLTPLFPFGYGLSYTSFETSDLMVSPQDGTIVAELTVRNVGNRPGIDTPQLYVEHSGAAGFASRLGAFTRVALAPGQTQHVRLTVDPRLLARFDPALHAWRIEGGRYDLRIAGSATDRGIAATTTLDDRKMSP